MKLSRDNLPFLLHDDTLDRTSNGRGDAGGHAWVELSLLDAGGWHSRRYAGEPMPTLAAIAHYVRRNRFALNIEIKPTPGHDERTGRIVARDAARLWMHDARPPLLSSFQPQALQAAQQAAPVTDAAGEAIEPLPAVENGGKEGGGQQ